MSIARISFCKLRDYILLKKYKKFNIPIKGKKYWYVKNKDFITKKEFIGESFIIGAFSDYCEDNLVYYFCYGNIEKLDKEYGVYHEHYFEDVIEKLYNYPETFYIKKEDEKYYSKRELEFLKRIQKKLLEDGLKDIGTLHMNEPYSRISIEIKYNYEELRKRNIKRIEGLSLKKHKKIYKN